MATLLSDLDYDNFHRVQLHGHHSTKRTKSFKPLPLQKGTQVLNQSVVDQVSTFVMFIGYPRSGHSIVASCLDAHPDAIVAHEFNLLVKLMQPDILRYFGNRTVLFDSLYQNSFRQSVLGWRSPGQTLDKKGYTLKINSSDSWQGKFRRLNVIGDKSGGLTTHSYRDSPTSFIRTFKELTKIVQVPIKFLHVVRNPYDIIATKLLYRLSERKGKRGNFSAERPISDVRQIMQAVKSLEAEVKAVQESINKLKLLTLEVHNVDFILHTRNTMMSVCVFLGLECTEKYLQLCDEATYNQPSKSRDSVVWTDTTQWHVDQLIQDYPFFNRYSFTRQ